MFFQVSLHIILYLKNCPSFVLPHSIGVVTSLIETEVDNKSSAETKVNIFVPVQPCLQCSGPAAVRSITCGNAFGLPLGSHSALPIPVLTHGLEGKPIRAQNSI